MSTDAETFPESCRRSQSAGPRDQSPGPGSSVAVALRLLDYVTATAGASATTPPEWEVVHLRRSVESAALRVLGAYLEGCPAAAMAACQPQRDLLNTAPASNDCDLKRVPPKFRSLNIHPVPMETTR